jgi:hypothetical protein
MVLSTNQKIKSLIDIAMRLYNPDVMYTYTGKGSNEDDVVKDTKKTLRTHLTVKPDDTLLIAIFRMFVYFFVCGRHITATSSLTYFPVFKERTRTHLKVFLKPVQKGKKIIRGDGKIEAAPYSDFTIPHFLDDESIRVNIPEITIGGWTVKITFKDQSYILIRTLTREEGIKTVLELAKYVNPKYYPDGGLVESNLSINEPNEGKRNKLHGIKMKCYKQEFYPFGSEKWKWARNI